MGIASVPFKKKGGFGTLMGESKWKHVIYII